jgi:hypothetical protein
VRVYYCVIHRRNYGNLLREIGLFQRNGLGLQKMTHRGRTIGGIYYPSVTEILAAVGLGPQYDGMPPDRRAYAMARGSAVHKAIELEWAGQLSGYQLHAGTVGYVDAFRRWRDEVKPTLIAAEPELISHRWRFLGHPDLVADLGDSRIVVVEYKCGKVPPEAVYQAQAYRILALEHYPGPVPVIALELHPDGSYRHWVLDLPQTDQVIHAAIIVYREQRYLGRSVEKGGA